MPTTKDRPKKGQTGGPDAPVEILKRDEIESMRMLWSSSPREYWLSCRAYADETGANIREITRAIWQGTPTYEAFWVGRTPR